jgi:hypothetical protein
MAVNKNHDEFHTLDMKNDWEKLAGYPDGIEQKVLSGAIDEAAGAGSRTRPIRPRLLGRGLSGLGRSHCR